MRCALADEPSWNFSRRKDVAAAFANPEAYDWSGIPGPYETSIDIAIEQGYSFLYGHRPLVDRDEMHKIVNGFGSDGPSIRFTSIIGGWKLTRVE